MKRISPKAWLEPSLLVAFFMIAFQMAGKAIRDALFLSHFSVTSLPIMYVAGALVALGGAVLLSILLRRHGPSRLVPISFLLSSGLLLAEWSFLDVRPQLIAVLFYLHFAGLGSVVISLFWSLVNEVYDPHRAKIEVSRIASAAASGGVVGGLIVERLGALQVDTFGLVLLSFIHLSCALASWRLPSPKSSRRNPTDESWGKGFREARAHPLIRYTGLLVGVNALAAGLIDYVFKAQASQSFSGAGLLRFFALFYLSIGLLTWLLQSLAGRYLLQRAGLTGAMSLLSWGVLAGSLGSLLFMGPLLPVLNRGWEMVVRSSFYRSAYEVLFTPVSPELKRASKPVIDIGVERLGDAASGAVMLILLWMAPLVARQGALWLALFAALAGLLLVRKIATVYVQTLQKSLQQRAQELSLVHLREHTEEALLKGATLQDLTVELSGIHQLLDLDSLSLDSVPTRVGQIPTQPADYAPPDPTQVLRRELVSGDLIRARRALRDPACGVPELLPELIPLLAWDEASRYVRRVLRKLASNHTGQLLDALLEPRQELSVRRQIPEILDGHPSPLAVSGLLIGLRDSRFPVRFQCAKTLHRMSRRLDWQAPRGQVVDRVMDELQAGEERWKNRRLTERETRGTILLKGLKKPPSDPSFLYVFTLLSLIYPEGAMQLSFQALTSRDVHLRGTAIEYLQSTLPGEMLSAMLAVLELQEPPGSDKDQDQALKSLMESQELIIDQLIDKD